MRFVLDSNIVIAALNGVPPVCERLRVLQPRDIGLPAVVLGELIYGAQRSRRRAENLARIEQLRRKLPILPVDENVAQRYGLTRAELQGQGITKTDFDLVIACTAVEHSATLVTDDARLLDGSINELRAENWLGGGGG